MKYKIVYRPFVKDDLQNAVNYYKNISPKLAKEFLFRVKEAKNYIFNNPEADDLMYNDIRIHNFINSLIIFIIILIKKTNKLSF